MPTQKAGETSLSLGGIRISKRLIRFELKFWAAITLRIACVITSMTPAFASTRVLDSGFSIGDFYQKVARRKSYFNTYPITAPRDGRIFTGLLKIDTL